MSTQVPDTNTAPLTKDDILDELIEPEIQDDNESPIPLENTPVKSSEEILADDTDESDDSEEPEEIDEIKEIEKELDEEEKLKSDDEESLEELIAPVRRAEILKKYPKLFKDFPYLEKAYFRNQQFTELFSVPSEARAAKEKSDAFDHFDSVLAQGNIELVLDAVNKSNPEAFKKIADDYIVALGKVNPTAANHVAGNIVKNVIRSMIQEGEKSGDESLRAAASLVNRFIFGTSEIQQPTKLAQEKQEDPSEKKLKEREYQIAQETYFGKVSEVSSKVENKIKATIDANIDTKQIMSDYVRTKASEDVYKSVSELMKNDKQFQTLKDRLWKRAYENNYSKESMEAIASLFTSKAKTLLPAVIKKARTEALRGMGKRVRDDSNKDKSPITPGRATGPRKATSANKEIPRNMSTLDFLNQD